MQYLLATEPDVVSFTGSVQVGRQISQTLAGACTSVHLELGGKDPFIVCSDADVELAARGATWGAFTNCGQVCASAERLIVVRAIADDFLRNSCNMLADSNWETPPIAIPISDHSCPRNSLLKWKHKYQLQWQVEQRLLFRREATIYPPAYHRFFL